MRISDWSSDVCSSDLFRQPEAQRHREARGMRGGDQFFGVGAGFILETGGEAVGLIGEHARPRRDVTLAVLAEPLVTRRGATRYRHFASPLRSEEHTSELQSLMRISYAVFCLKKKTT